MDQHELLVRIGQAGDEGWSTLDFSRVYPGAPLEYLPPEIGNLTGLTKLNLSYNQLTALPPEVGNLTGLELLFLENNQMTALPSEMTRLINQGVVRLSGNPLRG